MAGDVLTGHLLLTATTGTDPAQRVGTLFDTHHQRLYRLARRLCGNADEARDLVQEVFLRVAGAPQAVPRAARQAKRGGWFEFVNVKRDEWRRTTTKKRLDPEGEHYAMRPQQGDQEAALVAKTMVWQALARLPPRRRTIVVLYELEGAAIPDIAKLLGVTAVTVRWHLSRGRRGLAGFIQGSEGQES